MKRTIKFRAWHKVEKKLCPIDVLTTKGAFLIGVANGPDELTNGGKMIIISPKDGRFCMNEDIELMQFTGLHDKNGREIYEGDILDNHYRVEWNQLHCGWALFNHKGYCHELLADEYNLIGETLPPWQINAEVIGNIWQNP